MNGERFKGERLGNLWASESFSISCYCGRHPPRNERMVPLEDRNQFFLSFLGRFSFFGKGQSSPSFFFFSFFPFTFPFSFPFGFPRKSWKREKERERE